MACGTPVACSNTTSLPEVGGEAVLYFDPLGVDDMAGAVASIMSDAKLREELSKAGVNRASSFSWRRAAEETRRVFREVLS
jgi:glycosyltransferase involved in cell wall biosynthesis